jgi:hypothetical protein
MKVLDDTRILQKGTSPILLEPVRAEIRLPRAAEATVHVLDHDGQRTGRTIELTGETLQLDTARDRTPYYLVTYE